MFEKASRMKLRFETGKGLLTVEDLWDLPLTGRSVSLDGIAKTLHLKLKDSEVTSFVVKTRTTFDPDQLRFNIVKHIIDTRLAERDEAKLAADKKARKDRILDIIARKEDENLLAMDIEDLKKEAMEL